MLMGNPTVFKPDGNDLKRVFYYYNIEIDNKIICPFHNDNRPSCHVNFDDGIFHCFACEASGDAYQFVKLANPKLDDLSVLILYHAILQSDKVKKLKLSRSRVGKGKSRKAVDRQWELEMSSDYYYGLRTIDWHEIEDPTKDYMLNRGFTEDVLNEVGAKLTYSNNAYPIIFPLIDMNTFKGYVTRTTNKRVEKHRKYMYNKGFSRIDTLAGKYDNDVVVLTEGYMDKVKMNQFGLTYVAAILGWKITTKQVEKLKSRGVKTVISALDTDLPGRKGTDYLRNFFDVIPFQFPPGVKDPGDLTRKQFDIAYRKTKKLYRSRRN